MGDSCNYAEQKVKIKSCRLFYYAIPNIHHKRALNFRRPAKCSNEQCWQVDSHHNAGKCSCFLNPQGTSTGLDLWESIDHVLHLTRTGIPKRRRFIYIINSSIGLWLIPHPRPFSCFLLELNSLCRNLWDSKKLVKGNQLRPTARWGKKIKLSCLDFPSSHCLINTRGLILASVYSGNSFSWLWLIDRSKEINSFISFYSISRALWIIPELLRWWMCSWRLMASDNKCIYHTTKRKTDPSYAVLVSLNFHYGVFYSHTLHKMYILDCLPAIFYISNSTYCCSESLLGWAFYFIPFEIDLVGIAQYFKSPHCQRGIRGILKSIFILMIS